MDGLVHFLFLLCSIILRLLVCGEKVGGWMG